LESLGYIRNVGGGSNYCLGFTLLEMGSHAASQVDMFTEARPLVKKLSMETQRTCHVGIFDSNEVVYVIKENTHCLIHLDTWVGKRIPFYCSAMGKALLAWQDEHYALNLIEQTYFEPIGPNTITDKQVFIDSLSEIRQRGWAVDDEESAKMVRCIAAPVWNQTGEVCAAIGVSTLTELDSYEEMLAITSKVLAFAKEISQKMGSGNNMPARSGIAPAADEIN